MPLDQWRLAFEISGPTNRGHTSQTHSRQPSWKVVQTWGLADRVTAINDGFASYVHWVIVAAGKLVRHFSHSTVASKALESNQQQMKLSAYWLIQSRKCLKDCWSRAGQLPLCCLIAQWPNSKMPEFWNWKMNTGKTLKCATTIMSAKKEVAVSNTYPITSSLINSQLLRKEGDSSWVVEFKPKV